MMMREKMFVKDTKGFTLVELIVVMAIFIVAIILSGDAFNRIAMFSKQQLRASESNIQGIVGLEMMRSDIDLAGYGLPWEMGFVADFSESNVAADYLADGIDPADFNDTNTTATSDTNKVPRAFQSKASTVDGRDYLVLKSTALGMGDTSKKWAYVEGVGAASTIKTWGDLDFVAGDRVVVLNAQSRRLVTVTGAAALTAGSVDSTYTFSDKLINTPAAFSKVDFAPAQDTDVYLVYGVSNVSDLSVPYNRVDYYINRPGTISARCAQGTGNLYKAVLNHSGGGVTQYPLLDCVADMQVVYALDSTGDGEINDYTEEDGLATLSAKQIREQLKEIRIYFLVQEGQKDRFYTYPNSEPLVGENIWGVDRGRKFKFVDHGVTDWQNYRWKVYTLVATPKNN